MFRFIIPSLGLSILLIQSTLLAHTFQLKTISKRIHTCCTPASKAIAFLIEMSGNNKIEKEISDLVDVDLEPPKVDPESHRVEVLGQIPGWNSFDLEANAPPKKCLWLYTGRSKIVVGIAIFAMVLIGIIVPTVVAIRNGGGQRKL